MVNGFNKRFEKNPLVASRVIDGVVLLVPVKQAGPDIRTVYRLKDPVAAEIWGLVDGRRSVRRIYQSLCREFDSEPRQVEQDLLKFLKRLESTGVIRVAPSFKKRRRSRR